MYAAGTVEEVRAGRANTHTHTLIRGHAREPAVRRGVHAGAGKLRLRCTSQRKKSEDRRIWAWSGRGEACSTRASIVSLVANPMNNPAKTPKHTYVEREHKLERKNKFVGKDWEHDRARSSGSTWGGGEADTSQDASAGGDKQTSACTLASRLSKPISAPTCVRAPSHAVSEERPREAEKGRERGGCLRGAPPLAPQRRLCRAHLGVRLRSWTRARERTGRCTEARLRVRGEGG